MAEPDRIHEEMHSAPITMIQDRSSSMLQVEEAMPAALDRLPPVLRAMRPLQWSKNLLVFAALVFTRSIFDWSSLWRSVATVIVFCGVSSAIYLINDVQDVEQDRLHPAKRLRPIAAGELSSQSAILLAGALLIFGWIGAFAIQPTLLVVVALYSGLMLLYNVGLKQIVFLDIIIISLGFVLRAAAGAVAIDVPVSPWLYICTLLLALLVGFGKRRHELLTLRETAALHRQNLDDYSIALLDQAVAITAAATLVAYSIYTFASPTLPENHAMMLTIPIVIYAVFRYLYLIYRKQIGGSPELLLVHDRVLRSTLMLWVIASGTILYLA